jgi:hypothetical protein
VRYTFIYSKDYFQYNGSVARTKFDMDVICCTSVLKLVVLIHVIKLNTKIKIKIKIVKSAKFKLLVVYKSGPIYKMLKNVKM